MSDAFVREMQMHPLVSIFLLVSAVISPLTIFVLKLQDLPRGVIHLRRSLSAALALGLCVWYFSTWLVFTQPFWAGWFEDPDTWNTCWLLLWLGALVSTILLKRAPSEKRRLDSDIFILLLVIDFLTRLTPWSYYSGP